jgi:transposase
MPACGGDPVRHRITDLTPGRPARLLEVLPGRTGTVYASWLAARENTRKAQVSFAALDPFRGYATALTRELPGTIRVLDAFHVAKLGFGVVNEVRRRGWQETLDRRRHKGDRSMRHAGYCGGAPAGSTRRRLPGCKPRSPSATRTARSPQPGSAPRTWPASTSPKNRPKVSAAPWPSSTPC